MRPKEFNTSDVSEDSDDSYESGSDHTENKQDVSEDSDDSFESESDHTENKQANNEDVKSEDDESESDSDSDDSSEDKKEDFDHQWEELRNEAPDTDEITRRIAVCNMDWDRIRAVDLLVSFNSFKPPDGIIHSVKIYPSEFGLKRMEEEDLKGPPELIEETLPADEEEVDDKKGSKYHREKLRQYQINRLKYYYAVVECDSPETANILYEQLNGMEYESSSVRYDLRFIPDDMTFDQKPTSVADKVPTDYKPRLFVTSALQQVKVDLTWDETDPKRREFFQKVFTDIDSVQDEIHNYLASASSESEEEIDDEPEADNESEEKKKPKGRLAKYRELLKSIEEKEKKKEEEKIDVECVWEPALKEKTEEKVKEKMKKSSLNPFEELLQKKKDEKKMKKKELKKQKHTEETSDSEDESPEASLNEKSESDKKLAELSLISDYKREKEVEDTVKTKKKKRKAEELDGFVADLNDPRFSAMSTSSLFNMVPSDQCPKKNDGTFGFKQQREKKFKSSKKFKNHKNFKKSRNY